MTLDEFAKLDLRIGKVLSAERIPGSDKLLKLDVNLGDETRQLVAGIGKAYESEALVGESIAVVANMEPKELMGVASHGMILAAHDENGLPVILAVKKDVPPGSIVS